MSRPELACVFDVQRFCVHDGPGIRTVVFFKGCPLDCIWCQNPEALRAAPEIAYWSHRCLPGCESCRSACPDGALRAQVADRVDWDHCSGCASCVDACPTDALVVVGRMTTLDELVDLVLRDKEFYEASGGGVTLSGGEPVLHSAFLEGLLPRLRINGIRVAIETAGAVPWRILEPLLPWISLVLFDLKLGDSLRHRQYTGSDNHGILANLERVLLYSRGSGGCPQVEVRMPVIPGINTSISDIGEVAQALVGIGVPRITLLPYNNFWESKLGALRTHRRPLSIATPAADFYEGLRQEFARFGVEARL